MNGRLHRGSCDNRDQYGENGHFNFCRETLALHKLDLFFGYIIVSGCIRKFGIPNGFFNGL